MLRGGGLMFCIANDPVPTVLDVFHKMFPGIQIPRIIYEHNAPSVSPPSNV